MSQPPPKPGQLDHLLATRPQRVGYLGHLGHLG